MKSTFLQVVDLCRPDDIHTSQSKWSQITLGWVTRAVPPLAIGLTVFNRTGKLRIRVYPRVGSGRVWVEIFGAGRVRVRVESSATATGTGRVAEMVDPHTPR